MTFLYSWRNRIMFKPGRLYYNSSRTEQCCYARTFPVGSINIWEPLNNRILQQRPKKSETVTRKVFTSGCCSFTSEHIQFLSKKSKGHIVFTFTPTNPSSRGGGESREMDFPPCSSSCSSLALSRRHIFISAWSACWMKCVALAWLTVRKGK